MRARRTVPIIVGVAVLLLAVTNSTTSLRGQSTQTPALVGSWLMTAQNGKASLGVVHADGTAGVRQRLNYPTQDHDVRIVVLQARPHHSSAGAAGGHSRMGEDSCEATTFA